MFQIQYLSFICSVIITLLFWLPKMSENLTKSSPLVFVRSVQAKEPSIFLKDIKYCTKTKHTDCFVVTERCNFCSACVSQVRTGSASVSCRSWMCLITAWAVCPRPSCTVWSLWASWTCAGTGWAVSLTPGPVHWLASTHIFKITAFNCLLFIFKGIQVWIKRCLVKESVVCSCFS